MNFAKGILESRKQHYRNLKSVLRPIPLNASTYVEIGLGRFIRVTLFDANHCAGAVMFLIEDEQKSILYTGDIRSESWWVDSLARNPIILPYCSGIKRLDNMYLDTTFAAKDERYRRFKSKAAGIKELLGTLLKYPKDTVFHFNAWTLGYEDVWVAISNALNTRVHVDEYRRTLYGSLVSKSLGHFQCPEGPALVGFKNGNHFQRGCLTDDSSVRLHSCEHGTGCPALDSSETVRINPIISKNENGEILPEAGAAGDGNDLLYNHSFLELNDPVSVELLLEICNMKVKDEALRSKIRGMITRAAETHEQAISLGNLAVQSMESDIEMEHLVDALIERAHAVTSNGNLTDEVPRLIQFAYSRHSSYEELCNMVATFRPRDIYPCTFNWQEWSSAGSVEHLFGHLCDMALVHDKDMVSMETQRATVQSKKRLRSPSDSSAEHSSQGEEMRSFPVLARTCGRNIADEGQNFPFSNGQQGRAYPEQNIARLRQAYGHPSEPVMNRTELTAGEFGNKLNNAPASWSHQEETKYPTQSLCQSARVGNCANRSRRQVFELSDDAWVDFDSEAEGDFLLQEIPTPEDETTAELKDEAKQDTQLTLSDSYFESQLLDSRSEERGAKVQSRKQAYKATQHNINTWELEYIIVSSGADHGEIEVEL